MDETNHCINNDPLVLCVDDKRKKKREKNEKNEREQYTTQKSEN